MDIQSAIETHPQIFKRMQNALKKEMISHALILQGLKETHVLEMAYALVLEIYNKENIEGASSRILKNIHPNIKQINALKSSISKDQILALQHDFNQTSLELGPKIYIINDAHLMNVSAQNALLKFLEEPHPNIYAIMVTHDALSLLPTIVSRSQLITFPSVSQLKLSESLKDQGFDAQSSSLASQCFHKLEDALLFLKDDETLNVIKTVEILFNHLFSNHSLLVWKYESIPDLAQDKMAFEKVLELIIIYLKDLLYAKLKIENFSYQSQESVILKGSEMLTYPDILDMISNIYLLKEKINMPIHLDLAWENLLIELESKVS